MLCTVARVVAVGAVVGIVAVVVAGDDAVAVVVISVGDVDVGVGAVDGVVCCCRWWSRWCSCC